MIKTKLKDPQSFEQLVESKGFTSFKELAANSTPRISLPSVLKVAEGSRVGMNVALKICSLLDTTFEDLFVFIHGEGNRANGGNAEKT